MVQSSTETYYEILILLLVCTIGVRSWQDSVEQTHKHSDEGIECLKEKYSEKYNDGRESTCKKPTVLREEKESSSRESGTHDDADSDTLISDEDDQSDLLMLGQEDQEFSTEDSNPAPEECPQQTSETNTCMPSDSAINLAKVEHHDQFVSKSSDVAEDAQQSRLTEGENEVSMHKEDTDIPVIDANIDKEPMKEELDPEQENVPLREILLKLKPEGLTDDEDEQSSDYSAAESSMGDESEVEEEALVSSGSPEKQDQNLDSNGTQGTSEGSSGSSSGGSKKAVCSELNTTETITDVEVINATTLLKLLQVDPNVTSRSSSGPCYLIYFFSPYCPFSTMGSPYVNALARSIPNIPIYGLDSIEHHSVNARYGVMGTPTLLLFHNGNGVGRYNASEYSVSQLMSFIRHYTDQELNNINVTSSDFRANLPSQMAEARPYALWAAWIFLLSFASWLFLTSELCARLTEAILNNWREAEAQNDHQD